MSKDTSYWFDVTLTIKNAEFKLPVEYATILGQKIQDMIENYINKEVPDTLLESYECVDLGMNPKGVN